MNLEDRNMSMRNSGWLALLLIMFSMSNAQTGESTSDIKLPFSAMRLVAAEPFSFRQIDLPQISPQTETVSGGKSVGGAFLLSLILPGAGEWYTGNRTAARMSFGAELLIWAGYISNNLYSDHLQNETRVYAVQHAGVQRSGKDTQYWIDIGKHDDIYLFNEKRHQERNFDALYPQTAEYAWDWDSHENRLRYDGKRLNANVIANRIVYFQAAVLLNHMISGVNAMRLARRHNRAAAEHPSLGMQFQSWPVDRARSYFGVNLSAKF
jgi:hypothetical protein